MLFVSRDKTVTSGLQSIKIDIRYPAPDAIVIGNDQIHVRTLFAAIGLGASSQASNISHAKRNITRCHSHFGARCMQYLVVKLSK